MRNMLKESHLLKTLCFLIILLHEGNTGIIPLKTCSKCSTHYIWGLDFTQNVINNYDADQNLVYDKMMTLLRQGYWASDYITVFGWGGSNENAPSNQSSMVVFAERLSTKFFNVTSVVANPPSNQTSQTSSMDLAFEKVISIVNSATQNRIKQKIVFMLLSDGGNTFTQNKASEMKIAL